MLPSLPTKKLPLARVLPVKPVKYVLVSKEKALAPVILTKEAEA